VMALLEDTQSLGREDYNVPIVLGSAILQLEDDLRGLGQLR
jgi:hypothetical protein